MVKVVFTFDVAPERQSDYLKATTEKIKPYWESHGCQSYDVWKADGESNTFIKEMLFTTPEAMAKALGPKDAEATAAVELWQSFITNMTRKSYTLKT